MAQKKSVVEGSGKMKLIPDFKMTPFSRTAWVSGAARQTWEQAIQECAALVSELEIESVAAGQRPCSWQTIARAGLPDFARRCAEKGLIVLPVRFVGAFNGFVHYTPEGDASVYNIIARRLEDALRFREAFEKGDHEVQGEMLGFPKCCREAFAANWKAGYFDPIWQSAISDIGGDTVPESVDNITKYEVHPYSNPLLRYIGLRVGFHIPHSFRCGETIAAGIERLSLAKDQGLVKILESLLSMPMRAELFHGILTVRTPIFYLITYSVPTEEKYIIEVNGDFIPKEGAWPGLAKK
jgi:hypothetical protein